MSAELSFVRLESMIWKAFKNILQMYLPLFYLLMLLWIR